MEVENNSYENTRDYLDYLWGILTDEERDYGVKHACIGSFLEATEKCEDDEDLQFLIEELEKNKCWCLEGIKDGLNYYSFCWWQSYKGNIEHLKMFDD